MTTTATTGTAAKPRRKRRIFMWVFLAIQALFLLWIITGATATAPPCRDLTAQACSDAANAGHGIAIALQLVLWVIADFLLSVTWLVVRLSRRSR